MLWVVEDLVWFPVFEEFTVCGKDNPVGYLAGKSHFVGNDDHGPYVIGDGYAHVALSTPDLEGLNAEHKAKGYEVTEPKGLPGTQPNYYFVVDPDGYKVEVIREK